MAGGELLRGALGLHGAEEARGGGARGAEEEGGGERRVEELFHPLFSGFSLILYDFHYFSLL